MSATEILEELPKLTPEEIELIFFRAAELREQEFEASPELLAALDKAEASFEKEGGIPLEEVEEIVKSWSTK